jgi:hypothetical protein
MHFLFSLFSSEHDWATPCAIAHKAFSLTHTSLNSPAFIKNEDVRVTLLIPILLGDRKGRPYYSPHERTGYKPCL